MITYLQQALVIPRIPICKLITKMTEEVDGNNLSASNQDNFRYYYETT